MFTLGNKNELFLDGEFICHSENIELDFARPVRRETVFNFAATGEGTICTDHTAVQLPSGEIYLYYLSSRETAAYHALAKSRDGVNFVPTEPGTVKINLPKGRLCGGFGPFYDTNPACPENERFKAICHLYWEGANLMDPAEGAIDPGLSVLKSADGENWYLACEDQVIFDGKFDTLNTGFWDANTGTYKCYSRYFEEEAGLRAVQVCESPDFVHWSTQTHCTYRGEPPIEQYYTISARPVPGAEGHYAMIPMRFNESRKKVPSHHEVGVSDCVFLSSRNGLDWHTYDRRPWIYPGLGESGWTDRNFIISAGFAEINGEYSFYSGEGYRWPGEVFVRYTLPKFRLGYVYSRDGELTTKPFRLEGDRITLNYNTSAIGSVYVDVLDGNGAPVEGYSFELFGNELAAPVDLTGLRGRTLQLKFKLQDAYVYSIGC